MPFHTYVCKNNHEKEVFFRSFELAEGWESKVYLCDECGNDMTAKGIELPLPAHFYGKPAGYYKPSPTQRHSYSKVNSNGNPENPGYKQPTPKQPKL